MSINRQIAPATLPVHGISFPFYEKHFSQNGIPVYIVQDSNCNVLKIEFVFNAGNRHQHQLGQAQATNSLITEGAGKFSANEISEKLDQFGSYLQGRNGVDDASLTLFCLPKHLNNCLSIVYDILNCPQYNDNELVIYKRNAIQKLTVNESRTSYLARRAFYETVFGDGNFYGKSINQNAINNISRETLLGFYESNYKPGIKSLFVSGNSQTETTKLLLDFLAPFKYSNTKSETIQIESGKGVRVIVDKPGAVQNTIRIGKNTINRNHKDFRKLQFLNLLLGGYFGSRLMKNIREEKGLTYGIYSTIETYKDASAFYIETEINKELTELGIKEILLDIENLKAIPIHQNELNTAKNYMLGTFLRSFDGPFSTTERLKTLLDYDLETNYYGEFVEIINTISPLELLELANTHFVTDEFVTIIAGQI